MNYFKIKKFKGGENLFFTSDNHFNHKNIINLSKRPFSSLEEMNNSMVENWNKTVTETDTVFILGDFCFGNISDWKKYLTQLNGLKILIIGNHDFKKINKDLYNYFIEIKDRMEIKVDDQKIVLDHYPMIEYSGSFRGSWQLFGHTHEKDLENITPFQYNVGVDRNNFTPLPFKELSEIMNYQIDNGIINLDYNKWIEIKNK